MAIRVSPFLKNNTANTLGWLFGTSYGAGGGTLKIYDGVQPGTGGEGTEGCTLLAEFTGMAWLLATLGTANLTGTMGATAGTSGTATWARLTPPAGAGTGIFLDADCGTSGTSIFVLSSQVISTGDVLYLTSAPFVGPSHT